MKKIISLTLFVAIICVPVFAQITFEKHTYIPKEGDSLLYRLMRPLNNDESQKYALVLFLHGAGERGNDNSLQLTNGVNNFASNLNRKLFPCYVVVPQCEKGYRWVETDWKLPSHTMPDTPSVYLNYTIKLIDSLIKNLNIDPKRIYITGISMGGFGTWDAISRWPKKFAAAVPVCGGADTSKAGIIKDIPIWAFHGEKDQVVLTSRSRNMIQALKKAGGNPKYTEYPELGHNIWGKVYTNQDLLIWLFSQTLANQKK